MLRNKFFKCYWRKNQDARQFFKMELPDFFRYLKGIALILMLLCAIFSPVFAQVEPADDAKGRRNPFTSLVTPEGRLLKLDKQEAAFSGELLIEGIIYDKQGRCFAIVNSVVAGIGDNVEGYQILKIYENKVVFIKDGEILEVELKSVSR